MKKLLLALVLLLVPSAAWAQCSGVFTNNTFCGNVSGANAPPRMLPLSSIPGVTSAELDALLGSTKGMIAYRNATVWAGFPNGTGVLTNDGAGNLSYSAAGTGTVSSIAPAVSSGLTFTPNPITSTGTIGINFASATELATGTEATKTVSPSIAVLAAAPVALTSSATITPNLSSGYNFSIDQAHSFTLANPTNITGKAGRSFCIVVRNAAVPESITFGTSYFAAGGTSSLALTETANALDTICAFIYTTSEIFVFLTKNFSH